MNIPDRWIAKLDMLPPKDFKTLMMAILRDESEPEITDKLQFIASDIYADIKQLQQTSERVKKSRSKRYSNVTVTVTETLQKHYCNSYCNSYGNGYSNVTETKEEKREASPPCSPSSFPPHPLINSPYNPPLEEKREEALTGACAEEIPTRQRKPTIEERFERLWEEYPKKNGKKNAFESYKRAITAGVADETIADGIKRYKDYIAAKHTEDRFILAGSTYFYQWRWQDEYNAVSAAPTYRENSGDEFLNYLNEELEKENAKRESLWTEQT